MSDIVDLSLSSELFSPAELAQIMTNHLNHVSRVIAENSDVVYQFIGGAVLAYWHPKHTSPNHAQLAFDASCEILRTLPELIAKQKGITYGVDIVLGTGEMAGDPFGPPKQFQIIGKAMAIADRISKARTLRGSAIRMSQYSTALINSPVDLVETNVIRRETLEDLRVFSHRTQ